MMERRFDFMAIPLILTLENLKTVYGKRNTALPWKYD